MAAPHDAIFGVTETNLAAYDFLKAHGAIRSAPPVCPICDQQMNLQNFGTDGKVWKCPRPHRTKLSIRTGSFWSKSKLQLRQLVKLAYFWSYKVCILPGNNDKMAKSRPPFCCFINITLFTLCFKSRINFLLTFSVDFCPKN